MTLWTYYFSFKVSNTTLFASDFHFSIIFKTWLHMPFHVEYWKVSYDFRSSIMVCL